MYTVYDRIFNGISAKKHREYSVYTDMVLANPTYKTDKTKCHTAPHSSHLCCWSGGAAAMKAAIGSCPPPFKYTLHLIHI